MKKFTTTIILIFLMSLFSYNNASTLSDNPDFAYPRQVIANSSKAMNDALKSKNSVELIRAFVQNSIAKSIISPDCMPSLVAKCDSLISIEKDVTAKCILQSFEAMLFNEYYEQNEYQYSNRNMSTDILPKDVTEWSKRQMLDKINECAEASISHPDITSKVALSTYKPILLYNAYGEVLMPTIYDYLVDTAIGLNGFKAKEKSIQAMANRTDATIPSIIYWSLKKNGQKYADYNSLYNKYSDNEYSGLILDKMYYSAKSSSQKKELYSLVDAFMKRYPKYPFLVKVMNVYNSLQQKKVAINNNSIFSTNDSIKVIARVDNVNEYTVSLYRLPDNYSEDSRRIDIAKCELIESRNEKCNHTIPFDDCEQIINFAPQKYGRYTVVASFVQNGRMAKSETNDYLVVSNIKVFSISAKSDGEATIFAVDGVSGKPLNGVNIMARTNSKWESAGQTKQGMLKVNGKSEYYKATMGADAFGSSFYLYIGNALSKNWNKQLSSFTDLGVYRPGERVNFMAILYRTNQLTRELIANENLIAYLEDANSKTVSDTLTLSTDEYGRIAGNFIIPKGGMNGTYRIRFKSTDNTDFWYQNVEVAEYKTPTFTIKFKNLPNQFNSKDGDVTIMGNAETYSGVPMANMTVSLELNKSNWSPWWRGISQNGEFIESFEAETDAEGNFKLSIPISKLKENTEDDDEYSIWSFPMYEISADITSLSGETQSTTGTFILDSFSRLSFTDETNFDISQPIILPVIEESSDENASKECSYSISTIQDKVVASGKFVPSKSEINLSNLSSGEYRLSVNILGDEKKIEKEIILYRPNDKSCPADTMFWIANNSVQANANGKTEILMGSNTDSNIYYILHNDKEELKSDWKNIKAGLIKFPIAIPKNSTTDVTITFYVTKNFKTSSYTVTVHPYLKPDKLNMVIESFRDKVTAGDKEMWQFHFTDKNGKPLQTAMALDIYDKAIDAVMSNSLAFAPRSLYSLSFDLNKMNLEYIGTSISGTSKNPYKSNLLEIPTLNMYGYNLFQGSPRLEMSSRIMSKSDIIMSDMAPEANEMAPKQASKKFNDVALRIGELKVAMWQPLLTSDANGNLVINFEVPNYNTTWMFRTTAYTKDFLINNSIKEFVSQKPLMVQPNLPRFLRQGDKATINAVVINATDKVMDCDVIVELFNPTDNKIITTTNEKLNIESKGQKPFSIDWQVPDTVSFVEYRIKDISGNFSDGEQNVIPILSSISPVVESQPFYMNPGQANLDMPINAMPKDARVTLEYCNNPTWYCVTALPSIFSTGATTSTEISHTLYSIIMAKGMAEMNPSIRKAIEYWNEHPEDSVLVSMLEKNPSLKIGELKNSPWLNDAQRQTLQMQDIIKLYDNAYIDDVKANAIKSLGKLQNADGGWSWFSNLKSSYYTTSEVLMLLGELNQLGYLKNETEINEMIAKGVQYIDKEVIKEYNKQSDKTDYSSFCYFSYVRSFFPEISISNSLQGFINKATTMIASKWKKYSLPNKAYAAMLLKHGNRKEAQNIIRSIKEFSISTPTQGRYWDNLQVGGYWYYDKITATSLMLQAINAVNPDDEVINSVRQWILLQKQTNDWGNSSLATDAIYTILSTGTQWLSTNSTPSIKIGDKPIVFNKFEKYTGYGIRNISVPATASTLSINRSGESPAWGAIYSQYSAPMKDIKAASTEDLSITKTLLDVNGNRLINSDSFKVGDKVRVLLTIKSKQNLEYVTLHDERSATMEPTDQISNYVWKDGVGYYLEVKDSSTNLFFGYLPKGTHLISYDVTITAKGDYNLGIATIQSQYSPQFTAHSAGSTLIVK